MIKSTLFFGPNRHVGGFGTSVFPYRAISLWSGLAGGALRLPFGQPSRMTLMMQATQSGKMEVYQQYGAQIRSSHEC